MTLTVKMTVERMLESARGVVRDDGESTDARHIVTDVIGIVCSVGKHNARGASVKQWQGLGRITAMTGCQSHRNRCAKAAHGQVDLRGQAALGATKGLIKSPFFAPAAC